jgi:hypothetical protein
MLAGIGTTVTLTLSLTLLWGLVNYLLGLHISGYSAAGEAEILYVVLLTIILGSAATAHFAPSSKVANAAIVGVLASLTFGWGGAFALVRDWWPWGAGFQLIAILGSLAAAIAVANFGRSAGEKSAGRGHAI